MKRCIFFEAKKCYRYYMWPVFHEMERRGYKCFFAWKNTSPAKWGCDYAFVWNGHDSRVLKFLTFLKHNDIPHAFIESGFFPQLTKSFVSKHGSIGRFLFTGERIEQPSDEDLQSIESLRSKYVPGVSCKYRGHVAGMLQLEQDTSITSQFEFCGMQQFVDRVESEHEESEVVFRAHPYDRRPAITTRSPLSKSRSMWEHVIPARKVVGINSTSLYEAALAGKEVHAYGDCALSRNQGNHDGVLAEIIKREIDVNQKQCSDQLDRSLGENSPR